MAKKQIKQWYFVPDSAPSGGSGYLTIPGNWELNQLLLITNLTRGTILYNFADTSNTGASVSFTPGGVATSTGDSSVVTYGTDLFNNAGTAKIQNAPYGLGETTINFSSSTYGMSSGDSISIFVEDKYQMVRIWGDFGTDAIERVRVAPPQNMIDADFEYGLQATKWQSVELVNQYPSIYEAVGIDITPYTITSDGATFSNITVNTYPTMHSFVLNSPFTIQQLDPGVTGYARAQGSYLVYANTGVYSFSYYAKGVVGTNGVSLLTPRTAIRKGGFYSGSTLSTTSIASDGNTPSLITLTFGSAHGFTPGMPLLLAADPDYNGKQFAALPGSYYANAITSSTTCNFYARGTIAAGTYTPTPGLNQIATYVRPDGFFQHRPGDGGVLLGTASSVHGATAQRQTKKYFRYQSGKSLLYTTGVLFAPNYDIVDMRLVNPSVVTPGVGQIVITTAIPHGLQVGAVIRIVGMGTIGYNGTYTVLYVNSDTSINVLITGSISSGDTIGDISAVPKLYMYQWYGSCIRTGPHDDQNGMFFEYDGFSFNVVKRTSTLQLAGTATFTPGSTLISGVGTKWGSQLKIGDRVVMKGMVHKVNYINSDTSISVTPYFRGVTATAANYLFKVVESRWNQSQFSNDTLDGSGGINNPSGYRMDPNTVQMVGIQFTWYGAGFMDFMVRGPDGNFIVAHRMKQNNVNITASMRSANLPARYEVTNEASQGVVSLKTTGTVSASASDNIAVSDITFFPSAGGYVYIDYELIKYNSTQAATSGGWPLLVGLTRAAQANVYLGGSYRYLYGSPAVTHSYGAGVELVSLTASPNMSHWGSSYIMDGGFDFDRGYNFSYTASNVTISSNTTAVFGIRLSPSASNGTTGDLGVKELLNRAQLLLNSIDIQIPSLTNTAYSTGLANATVQVTGILNPGNYSGYETWTPLNSQLTGNQPSLAQVAINPTFDGNTWPLTDTPVYASKGNGQNATPGEKIFEFTAQPGGYFTQDLKPVKELTQSAIGGTGTFPNGADTIYVNVTLLPNVIPTTQFLSNVNITIKWAEAQA